MLEGGTSLQERAGWWRALSYDGIPYVSLVVKGKHIAVMDSGTRGSSGNEKGAWMMDCKMDDLGVDVGRISRKCTRVVWPGGGDVGPDHRHGNTTARRSWCVRVANMVKWTNTFSGYLVRRFSGSPFVQRDQVLVTNYISWCFCNSLLVTLCKTFTFLCSLLYPFFSLQ